MQDRTGGPTVATAPGLGAGLVAARGLGDLMAARSDGNPFVPLAATAAIAGVGVGVVGVGVALDAAVVALAGPAVILVGVAVCGWELLHVVTYSAEYLHTGGVVRRRRLKLRALAWSEVREVPVWVGDLFMPGQVLAYDVVSTAGRKMRVESSAKVAIGDQVAARARGPVAAVTGRQPPGRSSARRRSSARSNSPR